MFSWTIPSELLEHHGFFCTEEFGRIKKYEPMTSTSVKHRKKIERCVRVCLWVCILLCINILLAGRFYEYIPLMKCDLHISTGENVNEGLGCQNVLSAFAFIPTLDGCVSKHSFIIFSAWDMHIHVFSLTYLFWVHYFSFFFMRSSKL